MTDKQKYEHNNVQKSSSLTDKLMVGAGAVMLSAPAFANTEIDLTPGLTGVAIVSGLLAVGSIKALPTFVAWGIKKALSLLR